MKTKSKSKSPKNKKDKSSKSDADRKPRLTIRIMRLGDQYGEVKKGETEVFQARMRLKIPGKDTHEFQVRAETYPILFESLSEEWRNFCKDDAEKLGWKDPLIAEHESKTRKEVSPDLAKKRGPKQPEISLKALIIRLKRLPNNELNIRHAGYSVDDIKQLVNDAPDKLELLNERTPWPLVRLKK